MLDWKKTIRTKDCQIGDIKREKSIGHGKIIGINEILKQNERPSLKLTNKV